MQPVKKTQSKEVQDWAVQNDNKPLWTRAPKDVRSFVAHACCVDAFERQLQDLRLCSPRAPHEHLAATLLPQGNPLHCVPAFSPSVAQSSPMQAPYECRPPTREPLTQVTKEEYDEFFKLTFKEFLEPLAAAHFNVEGTIEFRALLFVPGMAPFEQQVGVFV